MSVLSDIATKLTNDGITPAGGIYTLEDTGPLGITRTTVPDAFATDQRIKPCILLKMRNGVSDGQIVGPTPSRRQMLEVWCYEDLGYLYTANMRAAVFQSLHGSRVADTFEIIWSMDVENEYDPAIRANVERSDFAVYSVKSGASFSS